jgi:hypothetical protein
MSSDTTPDEPAGSEEPMGSTPAADPGETTTVAAPATATEPQATTAGDAPAADAPELPVTPLTIALGVIAVALLVLGGFYVSNHHTKRAILVFVLAVVAIAATVYAYLATRPDPPTA